MTAPTLLSIGSFYSSSVDGSYWRVKNFPAWTDAGNPIFSDIVNDVSISPDGSLMAVVTAFSSPYIVIYNTSNWSTITPTDPFPSNNVNAVDFSPDGNYLCIATQTNPYRWVYDVSTWTRVLVQDTLNASWCFAARFDAIENNYVLFGLNDNINPPFALYDRNNNWTHISGFESAPVNVVSRDVALSEANGVIAILSDDSQNLYVWDLTTKQFLWQATTIGSINSNGKGLGITPDGQMLAVGEQNSPYLHLFNARTGDSITGPTGGNLPTARSIGCNFSKDGSYLYLGQWASNPRVTYWDVATWTKTEQPAGSIGDAVLCLETDGSASVEPPTTKANPLFIGTEF